MTATLSQIFTLFSGRVPKKDPKGEPMKRSMKTVQIAILTGMAAFTLACGYSSHSYTNPQPGSVPAITELAPTSMMHGSPGFTLTVNGSSFSSTAKVNFAGTAMTTTYLSGNQLMAMVPAAAIA